MRAILSLIVAIFVTAAAILAGYLGGDTTVTLAKGGFPPIRGRYLSHGDGTRYDFRVAPGETSTAKVTVGEFEHEWSSLRGVDSPNLHLMLKITMPSDATVTTVREFGDDAKLVNTDKILYQYVLTSHNYDGAVIHHTVDPFKDAIPLGEPRTLIGDFEVEYYQGVDPLNKEDNGVCHLDIPYRVHIGGNPVVVDRYGAWYEDGFVRYYDKISHELRVASLTDTTERTVAKIKLNGEIMWLSNVDEIHLIATYDDETLHLYKYDGELSEPYEIPLELDRYETLRVAAKLSNGAICWRIQRAYHIYSGGKTTYLALLADDFSVLAEGSCEIPSNDGMLAIYYDEWRDFDAYFDGATLWALDNANYSIYLNTRDTQYPNRMLGGDLGRRGGGLIGSLVTVTAVGRDGILASSQPLMSDFAIGSEASWSVSLEFDI